MGSNQEKSIGELVNILKGRMTKISGELVTENWRHFDDCEVVLLVFEKFYWRNRKPVICKNSQISLREYCITVHTVLGILDMDLHVCTGHIIIMEMDDFRYPHPKGYEVHFCKRSE